jgi:hypothetical protein
MPQRRERGKRRRRFAEELPASVAGDAAGLDRGLMRDPVRNARLPQHYLLKPMPAKLILSRPHIL